MLYNFTSVYKFPKLIRGLIDLCTFVSYVYQVVKASK